MFISLLETPVGVLSIEADDEYVSAVMCHDRPDRDLPEECPNTLTTLAADQLREYFTSKRSLFDFPFKQKGTEFQQKVWTELLNIPPGYPISYAALSRRMRNPLAIRAIAAANGKNNMMIVVPCHRVIGSSGELVGYAGGLWRKKWLLEHEAKMMQIGQTTLL